MKFKKKYCNHTLFNLQLNLSFWWVERKKEANQNKIAVTWNLWSNEEEKEINDCTISKCFLSLKRICFLKLCSPARSLRFRVEERRGKKSHLTVFFIVCGLALKLGILSIRLGCLKCFTCFAEVFATADVLWYCCVMDVTEDAQQVTSNYYY